MIRPATSAKFTKLSPSIHAALHTGASAMIEFVLLTLALALCTVAVLRLVEGRRRRRLREARKKRRAEEDRFWEKTTGQFIADDWRP